MLLRTKNSFNTGSFKCVYTNLLASALGDQEEIFAYDPTVPAGHGSITWKAFLWELSSQHQSLLQQWQAHHTETCHVNLKRVNCRKANKSSEQWHMKRGAKYLLSRSHIQGNMLGWKMYSSYCGNHCVTMYFPFHVIVCCYYMTTQQIWNKCKYLITCEREGDVTSHVSAASWWYCPEWGGIETDPLEPISHLSVVLRGHARDKNATVCFQKYEF